MINNGNHQDTVNVFTLDSIFIVLKDGGHKGWMGGYSLCTQTFFNLHFFLLASLFLPSLFLSTHPTGPPPFSSLLSTIHVCSIATPPYTYLDIT